MGQETFHKVSVETQERDKCRRNSYSLKFDMGHGDCPIKSPTLPSSGLLDVIKTLAVGH